MMFFSLVFSPEFSVFVGDLSSEVDDYQLHQFFSKKYPSGKGAKVVTDQFGNSRYGHLRVVCTYAWTTGSQSASWKPIIFETEFEFTIRCYTMTF